MNILDILRYSSVPGWIYNLGEMFFKKDDSFIGRLLHGIFDNKGNSSSSDAFADDILGYGQSYLNSATGAAPTGVQLWQASREDSAFQRGVADMEKAGLNSALMYGNGAQPSASSAGSGSSAGISDLLQLAMLPLQAQALKAQIGKTNAETNNINQRTRTEEEETKIRSVIAQYMPQMQEAQVNQLIAIVDDLYAGVHLKESQTALIHSQTEAQDFVNQYLPQKLSAEIANISANKDKVDAERKYTLMKTAFEKIQKDFAEENHFLMSSSDSLQICVYIASLLGISTSDLTEATKQAKDRIKTILEENPHYFDE